MFFLASELLNSYRKITFNLLPGLYLKDTKEAIEYVNQRSFIFFWPIKGILYPSLWAAVTGNRPVADAHDDPGHVTWGWKDSLLGKRAWYYAKVLRRKATIISLDIVPYFYALSENYGSPEEDYLTLYEQGRLTQEAKLIYEALLSKGVLDTVALRRATHMTGDDSSSRFERGLADLQSDFKILPVGVTDSGAWKYAFAYDITARYYPDLPDKAQRIPENIARQKLAELYFQSIGAAQLRDFIRLFGWKPIQAERTILSLEQAGIIRLGVEVEGETGDWIALESFFA
jgi:hypothetical protein